MLPDPFEYVPSGPSLPLGSLELVPVPSPNVTINDTAKARQTKRHFLLLTVSLIFILLNASFAILSETFSEPYSDKPPVNQLLLYIVFSEYFNIVIDNSTRQTLHNQWSYGKRALRYAREIYQFCSFC